MENGPSLRVDACLIPATGKTEPEAALAMLRPALRCLRHNWRRQDL